MRETTLELIKKFKEGTEISISAAEALTCRIVYARGPAEGTHTLHHGIKCVTGPNEDGNVLVLCDSFTSDVCSAEPCGPMETIDEFMKKGLTRIPAERNAAEKVQEEGCGTSCG